MISRAHGTHTNPEQTGIQTKMSEANLIEIRNLHATAEGTPILNGIDLVIRAGEIHAIMGPNGSGKSTLSNVLVGKPGYEVTEGEVVFRGQDLLAMEPELRAREGVFLAFQYPVEIPGVSNIDALRTVANGVNQMRSPERAMLLITHYQRLLDYVVPDQVHVLSRGRIVRSGSKDLAVELEARGYGWLEDGEAAGASA